MFWRRKSKEKPVKVIYKGSMPRDIPLLLEADDDLVAMYSGKGHKVSAYSSHLPPPPAEEQPE